MQEKQFSWTAGTTCTDPIESSKCRTCKEMNLSTAIKVRILPLQPWSQFRHVSRRDGSLALASLNRTYRNVPTFPMKSSPGVALTFA
jgi:hypothetical protein